MQVTIQFRRISRPPARKYNTFRIHPQQTTTSTIQQTQSPKTSRVRAVSLRSRNWMLEISTSSTWLRFPRQPRSGKGKRRNSLHPYPRLLAPLTTRRTIHGVTEITTRNSQPPFPLIGVVSAALQDEHPVDPHGRRPRRLRREPDRIQRPTEA